MSSVFVSFRSEVEESRWYCREVSAPVNIDIILYLSSCYDKG